VSTYRILSYNIRYGGAGRETSLLSVIRGCDPDLVILQEATRPAVLEHLARGASMAQWASQPKHSLAFLARRRVAHFAWHKPRLSRHAFLEVIPNGLDLTVVGVHLSAVHAAWTERRRRLELRALLETLRKRERRFHALVGDFNTLAPGEFLDIRKLPHRLRAFVWLSGGQIRWRTVQSVLDAGYADAYRQRHATDGGFTFPTWNPHLRLDYLFVPAPELPRVLSCDVVTGADVARASDHLPIVADLMV
jgi:endonuclease/exonuclease/phosphatase family metal-dependent hydrolase